MIVAPALARELHCTIADDPSASSLKITYTDEHPVLLSLKSPGAEHYRDLDMNIELVIKNEGRETFSAKPKLFKDIDWTSFPDCFVEIGTQWYFEFDLSREIYGVYLTPYFQRQSPRCPTPRFRPQAKALNCLHVD